MKKNVSWLGRIFLLSLILNLLTEGLGRRSLGGAIIYLQESPLIFLVNGIIIMAPFSIVFLVRRKWFFTAILSVLWLVMGGIDGLLSVFRTTPFTAADLLLVKYGLSMIHTYLTGFQIAVLVVLAAAILGGSAVLWKVLPMDEQKPDYGKGILFTSVTAFACLLLVSFSMKTGITAVHFSNIGQAYLEYGFPYCFSNSLLNTGISRPKEYDKEAVAKIEKEALVPEKLYQISDEQKPNIIFLQLESFFDPKKWENGPDQENPIPFFRYLAREYPNGYLSVPSVGAGTANTEFECVTGMNLDFFGPGEYPYKTVLKKTVCESIPYNLKDSGYKTWAIHNNEATFYERHQVFSRLGFDRFVPIEYMYDVSRNSGGWCRDEILTDEISKALDATEGADYIYTISVQGHGKYPDFEYYCSQLREMDWFLQELVMSLISRDEPSVLVVYGDHLPGFSWEPQEMENGSLFQTEYVIWNNLGLKQEKRNLEAYQLGAYVLDLLGIHEGTMVRFHQDYLNGSYTSERKYLERMQTLEYDILYGKREIYDGEMPYEKTDMKFGSLPVRIRGYRHNGKNLFVSGKNFNEYSKVVIDGKVYETDYVWPGLIIGKDIPEDYQKLPVEIWQIGRDKVKLGKAEAAP